MRFSAWRLPPICLLVFALVAAQALGLLHGIVHAHPASATHASSVAIADDATGEHWTAHLFGDHAGGSADCLLVAHGLASDLLSTPPLAGLPPAALPAAAVPAPQTWASAASAQYRARGPPA
jgi:hypothetical protein